MTSLINGHGSCISAAEVAVKLECRASSTDFDFDIWISAVEPDFDFDMYMYFCC